MKFTSFAMCICMVMGISFASNIYAKDFDIAIRHIDRRHSQGTVDIYRVKSWDDLKNVEIETNLGKYKIPELGTSHADSSQDIFVHYDDLDDPNLIIKKVTAEKGGKRIDLTQYVKKEQFNPMKVIIRK